MEPLEFIAILDESSNICLMRIGPQISSSHLKHVRLFFKIGLKLHSEDLDPKLIFCSAVFASLRIHKMDHVWTNELRRLSGFKVKDLISSSVEMVYHYGQLMNLNRMDISS